jgi:hypothetical protein
MLIFMIGDRVSSTIRKAEQEIRGLIAEAATAGEYDLVARLSSIARRLSEMAEEAAGKTSPVARAALPPTMADEPPPAKPASPAGRRTSRKEGYPRFEKTRDVLVKIGWSKKERSEYVHKAPKAGVDAVARRVMDLGKGSRMFTTDDLLPVKLSGGGDELPGYQAYICLAWLRDIGAVEQHGREGYSVPGDDLIGTVSRTWETLPASRR